MLSVSKDMYNWTIAETLLTVSLAHTVDLLMSFQDDTGLQPDDSARYTGFHYVDWHFAGSDIHYAIRTSYRLPSQAGAFVILI